MLLVLYTRARGVEPFNFQCVVILFINLLSTFNMVFLGSYVVMGLKHLQRDEIY